MISPLPSELGRYVPDEGVIAVDTESSKLLVDDGGRVSTVSVGLYIDGELHAWAWPFDQGPVADKPDLPRAKKQKVGQRGLFDDLETDCNLPESEWIALMDWLAKWDHVYHNAAHDVPHLLVGTRKWKGKDFLPNMVGDSMLGQWVLDPLESMGLKETAERRWDWKDDERDALAPYLGPKEDPRYDLVPWSVMDPYARGDAARTIKLWFEQLERMATDDHWARVHIEFEWDVCRALIGMVRRGVGYDRAAAIAARDDAVEKMKIVAGRLPFNPTVKGAGDYFYGRMGAIPHCTTGRGKPSVGECCVRTLVAQNIAGAREWQQYQKVSNAISRWYDGAIDKLGEDGRLRTDFWQAGTISMRFSSKRFNMQALPHDYRVEAAGLDLVPPRSLFIPRPGYRMYELDWAQAELRYSAKVAECEAMMKAIAGGDPHGDTARGLFDTDPDDPEWFKYRQIGKRANFALCYLVGPDTYQRDLEKQTGIVISRQESDRVVRTWRNLYPEYPAINRRAEMLARKRGYVKLCDGRLRWFRPWEEMHKAFNQVIQGGIAQTIKRVMVEIDQAWPETLLLQVHDSLVVELPEDDETTVYEMRDLMAAVGTEMFGTQMESDVKEWH